MQSSSTENLEVSSVAELNGEEMTNEASSSSSSSSTVLCSECRICQVEDSIDQMEAPCRCNGTLKVYIYIYDIHRMIYMHVVDYSYTNQYIRFTFLHFAIYVRSLHTEIVSSNGSTRVTRLLVKSVTRYIHTYITPTRA